MKLKQVAAESGHALKTAMQAIFPE